ncbi:MAG TPA: ATP-binding protein [Thermoanaerobaculia bacterium]
MAASVRPQLTRVSFRRDVRLFLASLVGFLIILLSGVLVLLQRFEQEAEQSIRSNWAHSADLARRELGALSSAEQSELQTRLLFVLGRYDLAGATVTRLNGRPVSAGLSPRDPGLDSLVEPLPYGTFTAVFDASTIHHIRTTFVVTVSGALVAAAIATILLLLYLPRITGPVEEMLASAAELRDRSPHDDEQQYLIDTFRESIARLKEQEQELLRLHQAERTRADDLERVTDALTRSMVSGFLSVDPEGCVMDVNAVARETLGIGSDDLHGMALDQAFGPSEFSHVLLEAVTTRSAINRRELSVFVDGQPRVVGLTTVPLLGIERQFLGMLALFTDLTPVRKLETRVREMQNLADLGEISAGIAHEFRNSLSAILGYLKLSKKAGPPHGVLQPIENAEREAFALSQAVDGLLTFAKPMTFDAQNVDLDEIGREIAERLSRQFSDVPIEYRGERALVNGDAILLTRAIENLLRNAIDSVRQKGSGAIRMTTTASPESAVSIEDEGIGLDPASVPRLFLPFQSDSPGGYGIGLPLVKKIVLLHDGVVELSGKPGQGALATIRLRNVAGENPTMNG